jgi:tripartite-type tricarboxylate transporter receptor subunit TctC
MKPRIITVLRIAGSILVGSILAGFVPTAEAQDIYPARMITIIVPEVPGSAADLLSRIIGKNLGEALGQPVNYENLFLEAGVEKATGA